MTTKPDVRELIARALCEARGDDPNGIWGFLRGGDMVVMPFLDAAKGDADWLLAALDAAGLAVVPVKATETMLMQGVTHPVAATASRQCWEAIWAAMLAAGRLDQ